MRIHYLQHADFESIGIIDAWARAKHYTLSCSKTYLGEKLPDCDEFDFLIVMGGPQSAITPEHYPYLLDEIAFIKNAIQQKKLMLGICLGAQLIAAALGAKAERSPHKEVGVFPINFTEAGRQDPILEGLPEQFEVVHWHNDMPGLPEHAQILAKSEGCPRQIIRFTQHSYGFQCHLEPTIMDIQKMSEHCQEDLQPGQYIQSAETMLAFDYVPMHQYMEHILDRLVTNYNC